MKQREARTQRIAGVTGLAMGLLLAGSLGGCPNLDLGGDAGEVDAGGGFDALCLAGDEGDVGAYWGLWDKDGQLKYV